MHGIIIKKTPLFFLNNLASAY